MWWRRRRSGRDLLRAHEQAVIDAVLASVSREAAELIERQLAARTQASRIIDDSDVMLYLQRGTRPDPTLALANRSLDLRIATVHIRGPRGAGKATVSAVDGWLFSIEFRPGPRKVGTPKEIEITGVTLHVDPMIPDDGTSSRLADLDIAVRAEIERAVVQMPDWAAALAAPGEMYSINLEDGVFLVVAQLPDTDFVVARIDPAGPGIRRYDSDGELVGEYATLREAVEGRPAR